MSNRKQKENKNNKEKTTCYFYFTRIFLLRLVKAGYFSIPFEISSQYLQTSKAILVFVVRKHSLNVTLKENNVNVEGISPTTAPFLDDSWTKVKLDFRELV